MIHYKRFFYILIPLYLLFKFIPFGLEQFVTDIVSSGFRTMGFWFYQQGFTFYTGAGSFVINRDCTGILSISLFLSLLFSTDMPMKKRLFYAFFSFIFFPFWNGIRIVLSITLGNFDLLHFTLWFVSTFLIVGLYYLALYD